MRRPGFGRRRRTRVALPAALWYPAGDAARALAAARAAPDAQGDLAELDAPVPGDLVLERRHGTVEATFRPWGGRLVPVVAATGTLFVSWAASPALLGRRVADSDVVLDAFLVLPPHLPERVREQVRTAGWRLGRPRADGRLTG